MFDLILALIFVGSAGYAFLMVWRKLPLLLQVPPQLIRESFVTRPSTVKRCLDPIISFFADGKYRDSYYFLLIWLLRGLRLRLLRMERLVFKALDAVQSRNIKWREGARGYLSELNEWKQENRGNGGNVPKAVFSPEALPAVIAKAKRRVRRKKSASRADASAVGSSPTDNVAGAV